MDGLFSTLSGPFAGRYVIERQIGHGATAVVYLAKDTERDRLVAIKVLRPELAQSLGSSHFLREIKLTQALSHPRILPVLDSGEFDAHLYFVLPYMNEGSLRDRLNREPQLPIGEAVVTACKVAEALAFAHDKGYVHRDVKPENILFSDGETLLADFGIARAIERSVEDPSTSTGIARGTPAYMSPEQASAAHDYDGRSDIYSLACVLYEMIAGVRAFIAATTQAVIAQRFQHAPRELRVYRPNVPPKLEAAIHRALQVYPADRYRTADEFAQTLCAIPIDLPTAASDREPWLRRISRTQGRRIALGAGSLIVAGAVFLGSRNAWSYRGTGVVMDTTRIVILPLQQSTAGAAPWRDDDLLYQALARWRGVQVVDQFQVADGLRGAGTNVSAARASELATSLGAGRYIRGELTRQGNGSRVYVALYDVATARTLYTAADRVPTDLSGAAATYSRLADSLLLRGAKADPSVSGQTATRSLPAVQAFSRAQTSLDTWDLGAADSAFQAATVFDPDYARASFWLAQVRAWRGRPLTTWTALAERASALGEQLSERELRLAGALVMLGRDEYARACDEYERLRASNDRDFAAWFGLGQCRTMDRIVVPDPTSPSKWRFRSSAARAMDAYSTAFKLLPSVHRGYERGSFETLRSILLLSTDLRVGYGLRDSARFYARPGLISDTLVLVPYPWQVVFDGSSTSIPPGFEQALARRRADFRRIAATWSAAFPRSAAAKRAVALSLELLGDATSIDTLRLARRLETDSSRRLQLAAGEVVLLTKFGAPDDLVRLRSARVLADSLLRRTEGLSVADADALAPVAAMSGRCDQTDRLSRAMVPAIGYENIPAALIGDANALVARIAMGCRLGETTLRSVAAAIARTYGTRNESNRLRVEQMLLYRPVVLAYSVERELAERFTARSTDSLLITINALLRGERPRARTALTSVENRADPRVPTPDITLARARLWIDLGDSAQASRTLEKSLDALRSLDSNDLSDPGNAGSLVSAMVLRADLAAASGDVRSTKRWAAAAGTLLSTADEGLKPLPRAIYGYLRVR